VEEGITGAATGSRVTVVAMGGTVGRITQHIVDGPQFEVGRRDLLFLVPAPEAGTFRIYGLSRGQLDVDRGGDTCAGRPCWANGNGKGWRFKDRDAASDGVRQIKLSGGAAGRSKLQVKAANDETRGQLSMPTGITAALQAASSVNVQFVRSDASCFEVVVDEIRSQEPDFFKGGTK
jgi:hypothetical protein